MSTSLEELSIEELRAQVVQLRQEQRKESSEPGKSNDTAVVVYRRLKTIIETQERALKRNSDKSRFYFNILCCHSPMSFAHLAQVLAVADTQLSSAPLCRKTA